MKNIESLVQDTYIKSNKDENIVSEKLRSPEEISRDEIAKRTEHILSNHKFDNYTIILSNNWVFEDKGHRNYVSVHHPDKQFSYDLRMAHGVIEEPYKKGMSRLKLTGHDERNRVVTYDIDVDSIHFPFPTGNVNDSRN